jgi:dTDP-4-dehydrorhamnose reductase
MTNRRLFITGGGGMLARTLERRLPQAGWEVHAPTEQQVNILDLPGLCAAVAAVKPAAVIHAAAITAVDACETTKRELAFQVNGVGSGNVAIAAQRAGARVVAISTDYVFGGDLDRPYHEFDATGPKTVYGASKLAGEHAVRAHCPEHLIARIAWLYGPGGPSFVHTMLKHGALAGKDLQVVDDQIGNPTSTDVVADGLVTLLERGAVGTFHLTCAGETTWFGFTQAIMRHANLARGVQPCTTAQYAANVAAANPAARSAPRPANSRLDKLALRTHGLGEPMGWEDALVRFLREHPNR